MKPWEQYAPELITDLYELTMAESYLREGVTGEATFSLFIGIIRRIAPASFQQGSIACSRFYPISASAMNRSDILFPSGSFPPGS